MNYLTLCSEGDVVLLLSKLYGIRIAKIERYCGIAYVTHQIIDVNSVVLGLNLGTKKFEDGFVASGQLSDIFYVGDWRFNFRNDPRQINDYSMSLIFNQIFSFNMSGGTYQTEQMYVFKYDSDTALNTANGGVWPTDRRNDVWTFIPEKNFTASIVSVPLLRLDTGSIGSRLAIQAFAFFDGFRFFLR